MTSNNEDTTNYLETILFIVFFFVFASAFSDKSDYQDSNTFPYSLQYELESFGQPNQLSAVTVDGVQIPPALKTCIDAFYYSGLNYFNEHFRISAWNSKISQNIKSSRNAGLEIDTPPFWRFYFYFTSADREDFPILS
jgi:hypothetical protein